MCICLSSHFFPTGTYWLIMVLCFVKYTKSPLKHKISALLKNCPASISMPSKLVACSLICLSVSAIMLESRYSKKKPISDNQSKVLSVSVYPSTYALICYYEPFSCFFLVLNVFHLESVNDVSFGTKMLIHFASNILLRSQ